MFMDWQNKCCLNAHITKSNIQIQCNLHQNSGDIFTEIEKRIPKFRREQKGSQIAKSILSKKCNAGGITIRDFKLYCRTIVTKTAWFWHKNKHIDQWIRVEDPEISSNSYCCLDLDKRTKNIYLKKDSPFKVVLGQLDIHM
jgi:hypothetical protein